MYRQSPLTKLASDCGGPKLRLNSTRLIGALSRPRQRHAITRRLTSDLNLPPQCDRFELAMTASPSGVSTSVSRLTNFISGAPSERHPATDLVSRRDSNSVVGTQEL